MLNWCLYTHFKLFGEEKKKIASRLGAVYILRDTLWGRGGVSHFIILLPQGGGGSLPNYHVSQLEGRDCTKNSKNLENQGKNAI